MPTELRYLLIVSCSQRKRSDPGLLPAIERYDGVSFRVLRKAKREGYWPQNLDVLILSAKYGLVHARAPIVCYEQRMTRRRANELKPQVTKALRIYARRYDYCEVYVDLGQNYLPAVEGLKELFNGSSVRYAEGRIGERLAQMKHWLVTRCREEDAYPSYFE